MKQLKEQEQQAPEDGVAYNWWGYAHRLKDTTDPRPGVKRRAPMGAAAFTI